MKKIYKFKKYLMLAGLLALGLASCKKNDPLGYTPGKGTPAITSVRTLGKTKVDSVTKTYTTIDSTGTSTTSYLAPPSGYTALDSTTATGNLNNTYEIIGSNLGSATTLTINGINVFFNRALGSDSQLIFTIPSNIPYTQPQTNAIVVTTLYGKVTYKFTVLPPPPTIVTFSTNDFFANSELSFTGHGFAAVTAVKLKTTGDAVTIVSQTDSTITLKMPTSAATTTPLQFTYTAGSNTGATAVSEVKFNDLDNAYVIFDDNYENGWFSNSWGPGAPSSAVAKTGTASWSFTLPKGNWWADGFGGSTPLQTAGYSTLAFWIKGGTENITLYLTADTRSGGFGNSDQSLGITVPANVWTYIQIPLTTANLQGSEHFGLWTPGPNDADETFYLDDVVLLK